MTCEHEPCHNDACIHRLCCVNGEMAPPKEAPDEMVCDLADLFKIFGDTTRMRILYALLYEELNVGAISEKLGMTSSAISHQLRVLKKNNLVKTRRDGKTIHYSLSDDHVKTIVAQGYNHLTEKKEHER